MVFTVSAVSAFASNLDRIVCNGGTFSRNAEVREGSCLRELHDAGAPHGHLRDSRPLWPTHASWLTSPALVWYGADSVLFRISDLAVEQRERSAPGRSVLGG
jgi:hypothetical protein